MRKLLKFNLLIFILSLKIYSQNNTDSIRKNWKYFKLKTKTEAFVIEHFPSPALCGIFVFASITIVKTDKGETFRVLNLCNSQVYTVHQKIKITPGNKPKYNVLLPSTDLIIEDNDIKSDGEYDSNIRNTTWGIIN